MMIIELLLDLIYNLLNSLLVFEIPSLPDGVQGFLDTGFQYLSAGAGILVNYTPYQYLMTLFAVNLAIDGAIILYKFIMWIIRKIPMLHVS